MWRKPQAKTVQGELTETTPVGLLRVLEQAREQTGCTGRGRDRSAGRLEEELREQPRQPSDSSQLFRPAVRGRPPDEFAKKGKKAAAYAQGEVCKERSAETHLGSRSHEDGVECEG